METEESSDDYGDEYVEKFNAISSGKEVKNKEDKSKQSNTVAAPVQEMDLLNIGGGPAQAEEPKSSFSFMNPNAAQPPA